MHTNLPLVLVLLLVALAACGGAETRPPGPPSPLPAVAVQEEEVAMVATSSSETSLPAGAPLTASFDLGAIDSWTARLSTVASPRDLEQIERVLELPSGTLTGGSLAVGLGLDPGRPAVMAVAPLDPAWHPRLRALDEIARRLGPSGPLSEADERTFEEILSTRPPLELWVRAVVPVHDAMRALRVIQGFVTLMGQPWRTDAPEGFDAMIVEEHDRVALAISHDASSLVFDVWSEVEPPRSRQAPASFLRRAAAALARIRVRVQGSPSSPPLPLDGDTLRAAIEPATLASIGFAHGVARVHNAASWPDIDPAARREIRAQGLREAHRILELAGTERGSYFERFLMRARGGPGTLEAELSADLGPAMATPPAAWARTPSIEIGGRGSGIDVSRSWIEAFRLPSDPPSGPPDAERFVRHVEEGGAWAPIVGAPFLAAAWPQFLFRRDAPPVVTVPAIRSTFDRVGVVRPSPDVPAIYWFGLMPAGATAAQASRAARTVGGSARVSRAGDRFLVIVADGRDAQPAAPSFGLARSPVSPGRAQADLAALVGPSDAAELAPWIGQGPFQAELDLDGSTLRVRVHGAGP